MNAQEFCYWLQGAFEVNDPQGLSPQQVDVIKKHLALVFTNVTSSQQKLDDYVRQFTAGGISSVQLC